jgi:hypothetical protein
MSSEFIRRYRVTHYQMLQFREQLSDTKGVILHGTAEQGEITLALPFGLGKIRLSYQHIMDGGTAQLEVTLIAAPAGFNRETVWANIAKKIEAARQHCQREI